MGRPRKARFVYAKQAIGIAVGAKPVIYQRRRVLNKRKNEIETIPITAEIPPEQEEDVGTIYVFAAGERVPSDHPAVKAKPAAFMSDAPDEEPAVA